MIVYNNNNFFTAVRKLLFSIFLVSAVFLFFPQKAVFSLDAPNAPSNLKEVKNIWQEVKIFAQKPISWLKTIWQRIVFFLDKEVEKRKPEIKEEFQKEKQEMKEDIPKVTKSLWEKFKELIK